MLLAVVITLTYASLPDILITDGQEDIGTQLCLHTQKQGDLARGAEAAKV